MNFAKVSGSGSNVKLLVPKSVHFFDLLKILYRFFGNRKRRVNAEETCSHFSRLSTVCLELHYESRVKAKVQLRFSYLCSVVKTIFLIF